MTKPTEVQSEQYSDPWSWASLERELELDEDYRPADYPRATTDALVEVFHALASWAVPLAVSVGFSPVGKKYDSATPALMVLSGELTEEVKLGDRWRTREVPARPTQVDVITGEALRSEIHKQLDDLAREYGNAFQIDGVQVKACRYAISLASVSGEFVLSSWRNTEFRTVRTSTLDDKRWISEPQTENQSFLPVPIEIYGTSSDDYSLNLRINPAWSYFGDKHEPGWQMITETAERLLATSDNWSLRRLEPGDPSKR